jgi:hypothetical protein
VEPFPVDVLPVSVANLAIEASTAIGCDVGMVAAPMLAIAGGLIGRSVSLHIGPNWFASASIFLADVALPGDGKSPSLKYASTPVFRIERGLDEEFQQAKREYTEKLKNLSSGEKPSPPPVPKRIVIEDATIEAIARVLAPDQRGLIDVLDELGVLISGLGQYKGGKGNDRANILKMWAGAPLIIDRVRNEDGVPIRIEHPCLSIVGNMPPVRLTEMASDKGDDGLLDRFLFVYADRRPKLKMSERHPVSNETLAEWSEVAERLWTRPMDVDDGRCCPRVIYFTPDRKREFDRCDDEHVDEVNSPDFPDSLRGSWSKLEEYAGRLCLILTLLHHAADPTADPDVLPSVTPSEARDAWRLITYFKSHHKRVRAYLQSKGLGGAPDGARLILNWIRNHSDQDTLSARDIARGYPRSRGYDPAAMEDGIAWLVTKNALRLVLAEKRPPGAQGRKARPVYAIHPDLLYAQQKQQNQHTNGDSADSADFAALPEESESQHVHSRERHR